MTRIQGELELREGLEGKEVALNSNSGPHRKYASGLSSRRPKKQKEPSDGEEQTARQKELSAREHRATPKCGKCGEIGHYRCTCSTPIVQPRSRTSGGETRYKVADG